MNPNINHPMDLDHPSKHQTSIFMKWVYALVLFGSATLIFLLFENLVTVNIYFVYIWLGLVLGLGIVLVLHLVLRN
ncbi:MAG: hypothetical protein JXR22_01505 [Prolixibacteraceae bacterium]|nr:hypothetical protein [Prolixibacteraceae bacterium]